MRQHFSGHMVKQLFAAIRSLRATNSHWLNGAAHGYTNGAQVKHFDIFKHCLPSLILIMKGLMMNELELVYRTTN